MPETAWNYWNLIKFNEHPREDGTMQWLMRKDQCMHCADPGCLRACPADGAIVQYAERHRRFPAGALHRLPVLRDRLPVQHPEVQSADEEDVQVHAVLGPRVAGSRARVHQGVPDRLPALRDQGRHDARWPTRAPRSCASTSDYANAGVYDPRGRRRHGRDLRAARHHQSRGLWRPAARTRACRWGVRLWKGPLKWLGNLAMIGGLIGVTLHYLRFGPKQVKR